MKKIAIAFVAILLASLFAQPVWAVGLGISPSRVTMDHLLRGVSVEKTIMLSRGDAGEELNFTMQGEGQIADWISTDQEDAFVIPAGEQRFPITVTLTVPEDTANGTYKGALRFISGAGDNVSSESGASDVSISVSALLQLEAIIGGDQVLQYEVENASIATTEETWPIPVSLHIFNTGNVSATPKKLEVEFWDKFKFEKLQSINVTDFTNSIPVPAFSEGNFIVELENTLLTDQYWAIIKTYGAEDELLNESEVIFDIVELGSMDRSGFLAPITLEKSVYDVGEMVKIEGGFLNTGVTNLLGKLKVEVTKGGKILEVLESSSVGIGIGKTEMLSTFFTPKARGTYTLNTYVEYGGKKTDVQPVIVQVGSKINLVLYISIASGIILLGILFSVLHMKKKSKTK